MSTCDDAKPQVVVSTPVGMATLDNFTTIAAAWVDMIEGAQHNISLLAYYITLTQGAANWPPEAGGQLGLSVFSALVKAQQRGVSVRVVVGWPPGDSQGEADPAALEAAGVQVRRLNWTNATGLKGVVHTKFMVADDSVAYLGSANFDWRSLSQVKELGLIIRQCDPMVADLMLNFEQSWFLAAGNTVPAQWPAQYWPQYNNNTPLVMTVDGDRVDSWLAVSPPSFCPPTRMWDGNAIIQVLNEAKEYARMSVMEYSPFYLYETPTTIWPDLDNAIRLAALRGVQVDFITASWAHTTPATIPYLQSLAVLPNITVRLFVVPEWTTKNGTQIPFSRVDHSKYIITESRYYITTSNWTPDYFIATAGVSLTMVSGSAVWHDMARSFESDWSSPYTVPLFEIYPP